MENTNNLLQWGRFQKEAEIAPLFMPMISRRCKAFFERSQKRVQIGYKMQGKMCQKPNATP